MGHLWLILSWWILLYQWHVLVQIAESHTETFIDLLKVYFAPGISLRYTSVMYNYQISWHTQIDLCACVLKLPASVDAVYYAYCTAIWFGPSCIYSSQGTRWCCSEFTPDCTRVAPSPMYAQLQPPRMAHMDGRLALNARQNATEIR